MDFTVNSAEFAALVSQPCRIASRLKPPATSGVLVSATDEVTAEASDTNEYVKVSIAAIVDEGGEAFLPAHMLNEIARSLPNGSVRVQGGSGTVAISCHGASFTVPAFPLDDFTGPMCVDGEFCDVQGEEFASAVSRALSLAAGPKEQREALKGVSVSYDGSELTVMGTDSYAGTCVKVPAENGRPFDVVLPASFAQSLSKGGGRMRIVSNGAAVSVLGNAMVKTSRAVEGRYPALERMFKHTPAVAVEVDSYRLGLAVSRAGIAAGDKAPVHMRVKPGDIEISASAERGSYRESVPCKSSGEIETAFAASVLKSALATVENSCTMDFVAPLKPLYIYKDGTQTLVMPVCESSGQ